MDMVAKLVENVVLNATRQNQDAKTVEKRVEHAYTMFMPHVALETEPQRRAKPGVQAIQFRQRSIHTLVPRTEMVDLI